MLKKNENLNNSATKPPIRIHQTNFGNDQTTISLLKSLFWHEWLGKMIDTEQKGNALPAVTDTLI